MLLKFFRDTLLFTIIYTFAMIFIITFYNMTSEGVEILYPILIAVFFYLLFMVVRYISYHKHYTNLNRLGRNSVHVTSSLYEYRHAYDELNKVYQRFGSQETALKQKATEDKRFISAYIHNLKTPVTVSSIIIQRVNNNELFPEEAITAINFEIERLNRNLNSLLELQRLDELQNDYEPQAVNIKEELQRIINANKSLFINSKVFPILLPGSEESITPAVYTDRKWNEVLLSQIISNAVKYSKDISAVKSKNITFEIRPHDKYIDISIKDEGIGIPEYDIPRIFEAFFTGENGRKVHGSSGIGLYLCKQICNRLGHEITIENDNGCKVTITYLSKL